MAERKNADDSVCFVAEVLKAIAREVEKRFKFAQARDYRTGEEKLYAGIFMGRFFLSLPEKVAKEISFDQEMFDC
jgi:hypothetical protein